MAKWTRDELILTLDLYLTSGHRILEPYNPDMVELLGIINRLRMTDDTISDKSSRTGGSIKAKMANLRAIDPDHESSGWGNGGKLDLEVWNEFANDMLALTREVVRIRRRVNP